MKRIVFKLYYLVPLLLLPVLMTARVHGHSGDVFTAFAAVTPTIDGVKGAAEWDDADCQTNTVSTTTGGTSDLTICVKNDETNLYLLAIVTNQDYSQAPGNDLLNFTFDNDHDGLAEIGDDGLALRFDNLFQDVFNPSGICCHTSQDVFAGGTTDLMAMVTHTNPVPGGIGTYTAEYQHPLDSADDAHDFSLAADDVVGFRFAMADGGDASGAFHWPFGGPSGFADIIVASGKVDVEIDIKPGSDPNCFNNNGHGVIPVAILTTDSFDASTVDPLSLSLDGAGVQEKGKSGNIGSLEDVDSDGDLDLVVHFVDVASTYQGSGTIATLSGETFDGTQIEGTDFICLVP